MLVNNNIGIIGAGFVGSAIANTITNALILDIDPSRGSATYGQLMECRGIFVCVPSPSTEDGHCDSSNLESVLENLKGYKGVIISKVTAPPDVYRRLGQKYPNLCYSPEFLTAANAFIDYMKTPYVIIGGTVQAYINEALRVIEHTLGNLDTVRICTMEEASMIKYATNSFLATKVVFMNELKSLCDAADIDYAAVSYTLAIDSRIGGTHLQVPGPDGQYGFGGACFPKDTAALLQYANDVGVDLGVLKTATKINTLLRLHDK
jgi:UDPglucose 6-dehydrogenase